MQESLTLPKKRTSKNNATLFEPEEPADLIVSPSIKIAVKKGQALLDASYKLDDDEENIQPSSNKKKRNVSRVNSHQLI